MIESAAALSGVRVIEISEGIAASFAGRLLGDTGAEVLKIETPAGDPVRSEGPCFVDDDGHEVSALFEYLNWGKLGISLEAAQSGAHLEALLREAQILVIGDQPEIIERWGLDLEALAERHPDLVIVTITPFGLQGPRSDWRATDLIVQAASGLMSFSGVREREPIKRGLHASFYETSMSAAYVAVLGYHAAKLGRGGTFADVSVAECLASELVMTLPMYSCVGAVPGRVGMVQDPLKNGEPFAAKDGYVSLQVNANIPMSAYGELLGEPRLCEPRFAHNESRLSHATELNEILTDALQRETVRDLFVRASEKGLLAGMVQTPSQLLDCPHLEERGTWVTMPGALNGARWRMPAPAGGGTPSRAPRLGQHNSVAGTPLMEAR